MSSHRLVKGSPLVSPSNTDTLVSLADILCCTHFWLCYFSSLLQFTHSFFLVCYLNSLNFQRISALFIMPLFPVGSTWQNGGLFFFLACFWDSCCLPEPFIAVDVFIPAFAVCLLQNIWMAARKSRQQQNSGGGYIWVSHGVIKSIFSINVHTEPSLLISVAHKKQFFLFIYFKPLRSKTQTCRWVFELLLHRCGRTSEWRLSPAEIGRVHTPQTGSASSAASPHRCTDL